MLIGEIEFFCKSDTETEKALLRQLVYLAGSEQENAVVRHLVGYKIYNMLPFSPGKPQYLEVVVTVGQACQFRIKALHFEYAELSIQG